MPRDLTGGRDRTRAEDSDFTCTISAKDLARKLSLFVSFVSVFVDLPQTAT